MTILKLERCQLAENVGKDVFSELFAYQKDHNDTCNITIVLNLKVFCLPRNFRSAENTHADV